VLEGGDISQEAHTGEGVMVNSDFLNGQPSQDAIRHMIEHLEEKGIGYGKVQYKLRDWLVSRQRYWGAPIPVVYDNRDEAYLVPESELPVVLPTDVDFRPTGESPLVHSVSFNNTQDLKRIEDALRASGELPEDRTIVRREYDTMDTFVCSSWYFLRYADPHNAEAFASPESMKEWLPVDLYVGGVEHAVLHLLYARFVVKALHAQGLVEFSEPFVRVRNQGLILAEGGEKMSKSKGNVVNPDEVVQAHSADTLRMYLMFMGPFEDSKPWNTKGIQGVNRFLDRVYMNREKIGADTPEIETLLHQTIKKVTDDIEVLSFNTAISQMMILNNAIADQGCSQETYAMFVQILAPFAPHLAEELWSELGNTTSVFVSEWPQYDPNKAVALTKEIGVQVNGKVRGSIMVTIDDSQEEVEKKALADKNVQAHIEGKDIKKVIYVEGRIVNIIV
jgi:leucyl-tRNA synthetase